MKERFQLGRPHWVQDTEASGCHACGAVFSAYRRKHHCRHCGQIFCYSCCHAHIPLPQFGYEQPVRTCQACANIAHIVGGALATTDAEQVEAARALAELTASGAELEKLMAFGGAEAIVYLCDQLNAEVQYCASGAACNLASKKKWHMLLADKGIVAALFTLIRRMAEARTLIHVTSALYLLATSEDPAVRGAVFSEPGAVQWLLKLASVANRQIASLSIRVLEALAASPAHAVPLLARDSKGALRAVLRALKEIGSADALRGLARVLAYLSSIEAPGVKDKIIQADMALDFVVMTTARAATDPVILCHLACTLANLAATPEPAAQGLLHPDTATALAGFADAHPNHTDLQRHCARGIANVAALPQYPARVLLVLPTLVRMLGVANEEVVCQSLRAVHEIVARIRESEAGDRASHPDGGVAVAVAVAVTVPFGRLGRSALEEAGILPYVGERLAKDGRGAVRAAALHLLAQCADMGGVVLSPDVQAAVDQWKSLEAQDQDQDQDQVTEALARATAASDSVESPAANGVAEAGDGGPVSLAQLLQLHATIGELLAGAQSLAAEGVAGANETAARLQMKADRIESDIRLLQPYLANGAPPSPPVGTSS